MCNIAAYVGTRRAAPILIEMLRRQEGMNAGFFTGLATLHNGELYYRKIEGDLEYLLSHTDVAELPGTVGFIHGRTPGYGGDAWSHPFIGRKNGTDEIAVIANGVIGCFAPNAPRYDELARALDEKGYEFCTRKPLDPPSMRVLKNGDSIHSTDLHCQLILHNMEKGAHEVLALERALCQMPVEMVLLMLSRKHPDRIFWSLMNKPMKRGVAPHGTYLASCAIAFPDDAAAPMQLPHCSAGFVTADSFSATAFAAPPARVAPIDASVTALGYELVCRMLSEGEKTLPELAKACRSLFETADCDLAAPLVYDILFALHKQGKLHIETRRWRSEPNEMDAPLFYMTLKA